MAERTESAPEYRPTATVSSLKSEDSTEQLICKTPQVKKQSVKSEEVENRSTRRRLVVLLGLAQVVLGALLVGGGAVGVVKGAALARVGAGLWAGCVAVVTGVVGVLAGINDCYGLNGGANGGPLLTAFLALSLLGLACGNSVAVLSATGLQRDTARAAPLPVHTDSFQDEMQAWSPVLANIALLIISSAHCLVCIVSIYQVSKRVCPCLRPKQAYDHNQFDPAFKPYVIHVDEKRREENELCKELEGKLQPEKRKEEPGSFGSATSKERLVSRWLGQAPRKPPPRAPPVLLLPARQASTVMENPNYDQGYFGPWRVCKRLLYNREKCGEDVSKFRPSTAVYIAGVVAAIGVSILGVFCILSVLQLAMISSKERVGFKYTNLVMMKLALALLAALLSIVAASLFAIQTDDRGFYLKRGEAFYVQIVCIVINSLLFIMSVYDTLFSRRVGGDPTNPLGEPEGTTINNPGFKDNRGISMTDSSGKPYSTNGHGSVASMNTTATTLTGLSDASTITRSPLRSSLKKPRPRDGQPGGLGIHNPGYSGHSPTLNRNGSQKKVRIQTHSTEV